MGLLCSCLRSEESQDKTKNNINGPSLTEDERTYKLPNYRSRCIPLKAWNAKLLYTIIKWKTEWFDNNDQTRNTETILGSKYELISTSLYYNDWDHYNRTMEPLMVLELFHSLQKDKDDPDYNNYKRRSLDCIVEKCETKVVDQTFDFKKLTIIVITERDGIYNYPLVGDFLKVTCTNQLEVFGYVENIEKFRKNTSQSTKNVLTVLIENIDIEPKKIIITTVKSMHINLRMLLALYDLSTSQFLPLILKPNHADYSTLEANTDTILPLMFEQPLNGDQMKIVANVVNTVNNPTPKINLIHGPPGTGKSTVIISIITEIMKIKNSNNNNIRILLCSSSNFAVDAILIKLLNFQSSLENNGIKLNIVRIGRYDKIDNKVKSVSLPILPMKATAEDHRMERKNILEADIIAATLGSCYSNKMEQLFRNKKDNQQIQVCIVDEAGQPTEIETLIPLMLGVKLLVLVGDPQQLPPTVISQAAEVKGMGKSLFARAQECFGQTQNNFSTIQSLNIQYRMANEIAAWPNAEFYHGRISNAANNMSCHNMHHYKVLNHPYQQSDNDKNECESKIIVNLLEVIITELVTFLKTQDKFPSIGIITPYCNQKKIIENMIKKKWSCDCQNVNVCNQLKNIEINTLDSFQGQEKDIIIMSCVRTKKLGFLNTPNRLNVGLTRAKQTMIVCGNFKSSIYQKNGMWRNMINDARERECFNEVNQDMEYESLKNLIFD